ncbi:MAG: hypothetical protein CMI31_13010 [Opitutae bacterium]|nr:hypothetical protein [Opitutae bacterium]|tara:strand:+ start:3773 stop:4150 length:378 start_codon:yes stop_codon:yes gene_type:complete
MDIGLNGESMKTYDPMMKLDNIDLFFYYIIFETYLCEKHRCETYKKIGYVFSLYFITRMIYNKSSVKIEFDMIDWFFYYLIFQTHIDTCLYPSYPHKALGAIFKVFSLYFITKICQMSFIHLIKM